jgi:uncharacterized protein YcgI (DUF1989 family)
MYIGFNVKYSLFSQILDSFSKNHKMSNFLKISAVVADVLCGRTDGRTDRQTYRHDEANSCVSQFVNALESLCVVLQFI